MTRAEVAVIGGGIAGASLAARLAAAGRDVLVIEREAGPHDKVCGEFLSREALVYLAAGGIDLAGLGAVPIGGLGLAAGRQVAATRLPFPAMSLSRRILDEAMLMRATACGARLWRGRGVAGVVPAEGGFRLRLADGEMVAAGTVMLATGKHDLRGYPRPAARQNDLIGFKMMFRLAPGQAAALCGRVELMLFAGGYAGLQPVEQGRANLCLLVRRDRFAAIGQSWPALLAAIGAETPLLMTRMDGAVAEWPKPLTIAGLPFGLVLRAAEDGLWRIGDQAAVIPSFSGDGMSLALHGARLAAEAYLAGESAAAFQAWLAADIGAQVRRAAWLSRLCVHPGPQRALLATARLLPAALRLGAVLTRVSERRLKPGAAFRASSAGLHRHPRTCSADQPVGAPSGPGA